MPEPSAASWHDRAIAACATNGSNFTESLLRWVIRAIGALPRSLQGAIARDLPQVEGQVLDPEVGVAIRLAGLLGEPGLEELPVTEARAEIDREARLFRGRRIPVASVRGLRVGGAEGPLDARLYVPARQDGALVVYFHGGGWTVGSLDSHDQTGRFLAAESGAAVLSVAYRLAPEHPFPAPLDDALAAFRWAIAHSAELGSAPGRVAVAGDSAGGNLAAVVARLAAEDEQPPAMQVLIYPVCDASRKHPSRRTFAEGYYLTDREMDWYEANYLAGGGDASDPRVSPLCAEGEDLSGLPPAYLAVAGFDPLRDEGLAYARRMRDAGVEVECRLHRGLVHAFANAVGVGRVSPAAMREVAQALRAGLA